MCYYSEAGSWTLDRCCEHTKEEIDVMRDVQVGEAAKKKTMTPNINFLLHLIASP